MQLVVLGVWGKNSRQKLQWQGCREQSFPKLWWAVLELSSEFFNMQSTHVYLTYVCMYYMYFLFKMQWYSSCIMYGSPDSALCRKGSVKKCSLLCYIPFQVEYRGLWISHTCLFNSYFSNGSELVIFPFDFHPPHVAVDAGFFSRLYALPFTQPAMLKHWRELKY